MKTKRLIPPISHRRKRRRHSKTIRKPAKQELFRSCLVIAVFVSSVVAGIAGLAAVAGIPYNNLILSLAGPFQLPRSRPAGELKPSLAREYIYAGSRLLAIEDAGAARRSSPGIAVWRPASGEWLVKDSAAPAAAIGTAGSVPVPGDYDGDGLADFAVYRPSDAAWTMKRSRDGGLVNRQFGTPDDLPVQADYDGDGKTDFAVWTPATGTWSIVASGSDNTLTVKLGSKADKPSPEDFDGDGRADVAVWRPKTRTFRFINSSDEQTRTVSIPTSGLPVAADYDGDGKADPAVRSGSTWTILQSLTGTFETIDWQLSTDTAVPCDYDGDGKADIAVWRPSTGTWLIRESQNLRSRIEQWGGTGDVPIPARYGL